MMSYETYKILHLVGVFMVVGGLTARPIVGWVGGAAAAHHPARKLSAITHGGGLLVVLIAGFGMLERGGIPKGSTWLLPKYAVWLILGGLIAVAGRKPEKAGLIWLVTFALAGFAGYCAITRLS